MLAKTFFVLLFVDRETTTTPLTTLANNNTRYACQQQRSSLATLANNNARYAKTLSVLLFGTRALSLERQPQQRSLRLQTTTLATLANNNIRYACQQQCQQQRLLGSFANTRYACQQQRSLRLLTSTIRQLSVLRFGARALSIERQPQQRSLRLLTTTLATLANNNTRYARSLTCYAC